MVTADSSRYGKLTLAGGSIADVVWVDVLVSIIRLAMPFICPSQHLHTLLEFIALALPLPLVV